MNRPIFSTTCSCGISAVSATTCDCGACTTNTTGTSTTFQMYCNCEISMVYAINLQSFVHCLNHRASVVDNSGHVNDLSCGSRGNCGISTVFSTTCTRNWGISSNSHDLHLWNLHDMHNQDVDHLINELQRWNPYGHLNNDIMRISTAP